MVGRSNIRKREGYPPAHILFLLSLLPLMQIRTVHGICKKKLAHWSRSHKDTFYRFKQNPEYRWRTFMHKINREIMQKLALHEIPQKERFLVLDDTVIQKTGRIRPAICAMNIKGENAPLRTFTIGRSSN